MKTYIDRRNTTTSSSNKNLNKKGSDHLSAASGKFSNPATHSSIIQTKLAMGESGDKYGQEVDAFNNSVRFIDPDRGAPQGWIKNYLTGEFKWDSNATGQTNPPVGYEYIGANDKDIVKNLFSKTFDEKSTSNIGLMAADEDKGGYGFYNGRVDTKLKVSISPQVETTFNQGGSVKSKEFKGIEIFATIVSNMSAAIPGGNPEYVLDDISLTLNGKQMMPYQHEGDFMTEAGNLPSLHFTRIISEKTIQQNHFKSFNYSFKLDGLYADDEGFLGLWGAGGLFLEDRTKINMLIKFSNP